MPAPGLNTKQFVDIHDIKENVIILKNGSLRVVLEVNSINFDLKAPDEQTAILQGFQDFLNSLDFPLQIVIQSRQLNIAGYLARTQKTVEGIDNELLRIQGLEYIKFVGSLVELANAMSKKFYIVVPLYVLETPDSKRGFVENIKLMFGPAKEKIKQLEDQDFANYKEQIEQRVELVFDGLQKMGLTARLLNTEELVNLFLALYNPQLYAQSNLQL